MIEQGANWFTAGASTPSRVDCHSADVTAAGGCEVDVEITPSLAAQRALATTANALPAIKVHAVVVNGSDGWQVREVRAEGLACTISPSRP